MSTTNDDPAVQWREALDVWAPPSRLQCMTLPNGEFMLVLDQAGDFAEEEQAEARARICMNTGARDLMFVPGRVDVVSWPPSLHQDDLATASAEACAMTHGEDDQALIGKVRGAYAAQAAEAEAWRLSGRHAVEEVERLRADLARIRQVADDPMPNVNRVGLIVDLARQALEDAA